MAYIEASEGLRLNLAARAALAHDTHEENAEAVVKLAEVLEHAHARMVRAWASVHAVSEANGYWMIRPN